MKITEIKKQIQKNILSIARDNELVLMHSQIANAVEDISLYLTQRAKHDQLFMLQGNESQDIYDAAKEWFSR